MKFIEVTDIRNDDLPVIINIESIEYITKKSATKGDFITVVATGSKVFYINESYEEVVQKITR